MLKTKQIVKRRANRIYLLCLVCFLGLSMAFPQPSTAGRKRSIGNILKGRAKEAAEQAKKMAEDAAGKSAEITKRAAEEAKKTAEEARNALDEATTILTAEARKPAYELAQRCYALKAVKNNNFLISSNDSNYKFADVRVADAEKFFLKPASLGYFMLYDSNGRYLAVETLEDDFNVDIDVNDFKFDAYSVDVDINIDLDDDILSVKRKKRASPKAIWKINYLDIFETKPFKQEKEKIGTGVTLVSAYTKQRLVMRFAKPSLSILPNKLLPIIDPNESGFFLVERDSSECQDFPEATVNARVSPEYYYPKDPADAVTGFIETHSHLSFPRSMAGVAMAGDLFHPLGIEYALKDCSHLHGKGGKLDLLGQSLGEGNGHNTGGYPNFSTDWPSADNVTHVNAYYKWIERAHLSGMKALVTLVTGNKQMCELLSIVHPLKAEGDCKSEDVINLQINYIYDLQNYVDAQEGGPGKGWFRIVRSPKEAREVISQNKLAVLLGTEYNTIFDCKGGADYCIPDYIDSELDELYEMGVRVVFPMHKLDNAFGGAIAQGGASGGYFNFSNKLSSSEIDHFTEIANPFNEDIGGDFWQFEECPEEGVGVSGIQNMGDFMNNDFIISRNLLKQIPTVGPFFAKFFDWAFLDKLGRLPTYEEFGDHPMCNSRHLQPMGRYLINRLIDKGMLIETDHMGYYMLQEVLDILEQREYPGVVSSHGISFLTDDTVSRIFALGGHISPMARSFDKTMDFIERYTEEMSFHQDFVGVGIGTDIQGMCPQGNAPEGIDVYGENGTFISYDGTVEFSMQQTGNRVFNFNEEGRSHYGLMADWIEAVRQVKPHALESIMNSAEAYLRMWESATN